MKLNCSIFNIFGRDIGITPEKFLTLLFCF